MKGPAGLAIWLAHAVAVVAAAPAPPHAEDFSKDTLGNGLSIAVGMLRVGGDEQAPVPLEGNLIVRSTTVTRLIADEATGATFGYRIATVRFGPSAVRVKILPLDSEAEGDLRRLSVCEGCPPLRLVASSVRYPPEQVVRLGETVVIDLLERSQSGERIVDVVKLSTDTPSPSSPTPPCTGGWDVASRAAAVPTRRCASTRRPCGWTPRTSSRGCS
jgi:hypothetical protein